MFEFQKLCNEVEALEPVQRAALIAEKAVNVIEGLHGLHIEGIDPVETLAAFLIGSVVSDGVVSEKDLLGIEPSLIKAFGEACDLAGIEHSFKVSKDAVKEIKAYTQAIHSIVWTVDEQLGADIVTLCLLVTSVDGKVSLKERRYIKQLCNA